MTAGPSKSTAAAPMAPQTPPACSTPPHGVPQNPSATNASSPTPSIPKAAHHSAVPDGNSSANVAAVPGLALTDPALTSIQPRQKFSGKPKKSPTPLSEPSPAEGVQKFYHPSNLLSNSPSSSSGYRVSGRHTLVAPLPPPARFEKPSRAGIAFEIVPVRPQAKPPGSRFLVSSPEIV